MSDEQDDFSFDSGDGDDSGDQQVDTGNTSSSGNAENDKRIQQALHRAEKQLKSLEAKNRELEEFRAAALEKERLAAVTQTFKALGLNDKVATLYTGEPAEESIKQWAVDYGLANVEDVTPSDEKTQGFVPGTPGGADPTQTTFTHDEIMAMLATDPARADLILSQGRAKLNKLN